MYYKKKILPLSKLILLVRFFCEILACPCVLVVFSATIRRLLPLWMFSDDVAECLGFILTAASDFQFLLVHSLWAVSDDSQELNSWLLTPASLQVLHEFRGGTQCMGIMHSLKNNF